jgi:DNA-directed RNA polymerase subunit RPC12/RpoP
MGEQRRDETMERSSRDCSAIEKYLATARERLHALDTLLEPDHPEVAIFRTALVSALGAIDEARASLADPREASRVVCPHCGNRVMPDATLCARCWHRLEPSRTS